MTTHDQLPLPFETPPLLDAMSFAVTPANQRAYDCMTAYPSWPTPGMIIHGPKGCGKTHLGNIWREKTGAHLVEGILTEDRLEELLAAPAPVIYENVSLPTLADEHLLFHLYNSQKSAHQGLLLTAPSPPLSWNLTLPDLRSRMQSLMTATIEVPDDTLLESIYLKRFADAQMQIDPRTIKYLMTHTDRTFSALHGWVDTLQAATLAQGRRVTIPMIKSLNTPSA